MTITVNVSNAFDNGDNTFTVESCDTQHLRECSKFEYEGNIYRVESFVQDEQIILSGGPLIVNDFNLPPPTLLVDSPRFANEELAQMTQNGFDHHPFIWVLETFETPYNNDETSLIIASPQVRLFFLDISQDQQWLNSDHRINVIGPMKSLIDQFIYNLDKYKGVDDIERFSTIDRVRFGKFEQNKGNTASILGEELSGVELRLNIPLKDCCDCDTMFNKKCN